MTDVLRKQAEQINANDIEALISDNVPESIQVEFKETLPEDNGRTDPWMINTNDIGRFAKDKILEEVVAFANAYGGCLVLGVRENGANPPVATRLKSLPRCAELARRFQEVFRDRVEPQLPTLEVIPVPMEADSGVIVFRTGRSRLAPHRITRTLVCPVRRDDRCEKLTMREIQDMTLYLARGTERLERRLQERASNFVSEFNRLRSPNDAFGFRLTAIPVGDDIRFESVYSTMELTSGLRPPPVKIKRLCNLDSHLRTIQDYYLARLDNWKPRLRAARADDQDSEHWVESKYFYTEIHADGLLEWGCISNEKILHHDLPISTLVQLLVWANRVRQEASAPSAEYVIQPQLRITAKTVDVHGDYQRLDGRGEYQRPCLGTAKQGNTTFPYYPLERHEELGKIAARFERDFWNHLGKDPVKMGREPLIVE